MWRFLCTWIWCFLTWRKNILLIIWTIVWDSHHSDTPFTIQNCYLKREFTGRIFVKKVQIYKRTVIFKCYHYKSEIRSKTNIYLSFQFIEISIHITFFTFLFYQSFVQKSIICTRKVFFVKKCQNNLLICLPSLKKVSVGKKLEHEFGKIYLMLKEYNILDLPAIQIAP